jgi:tetratricopeptide (TPR) repeat protein
MDRNKIKYLFIYTLLICFSTTYAQKNQVYSFPDREFQSAQELYRLEQYGAAKKKFTIVYEAIPEKYDIRKEKSLYYMGICAALLYHEDAEKLIVSFIELYPENSQLNPLWFYLGNYYFAKNSYHKAINAYENIEERLINSENIAEYEFKKGYAYFVTEKYNEAKPLLAKAKDKESQYQLKALFYYSHILYLEKNYNSALIGFRKLRNEDNYSSIVPFYITHIYFALGQYEDIIQQAQNYWLKAVKNG